MSHSTSSATASTTAGGSTRILLTGVTGFLGQAVLRSLLETTEDTHVTALVRPKGSVTGRKRLEQLLRKPVFASWVEQIGLEGENGAKAVFDQRVGVLEGDLTDIPELTEPYDVVIHSASAVSFDPPIDEAFRTNVGGARNLYQALLDSGQDPHVIHVSTAYVCGISKGLRQEGKLVHDVDWRAEYQAAQEARQLLQAEAGGRLPRRRARCTRAPAAGRRAGALRPRLGAPRAGAGRAPPKAGATAPEEAGGAWGGERRVVPGAAGLFGGGGHGLGA